MPKRLLQLLVLLGFLIQCSTGKESEISFEEDVFYNIFPALVDTFHHDLRLKPPPIPKSAAIDENGNLFYKDSTELLKIQLEFEKQKALLKSDSTQIMIAVADTLYPIFPTTEEELNAQKSGDTLGLVVRNDNIPFVIDLDRLEASDERIAFRYNSSFPGWREIRRIQYEEKPYDFYLSAKFSFSRILFNRDKSYGIFN